MITLLRLVVLAAFLALAAAKGCSPGPVDVMFVISTNDSLTQAEFKNKIGILEEYVSGAKIGPDDVRVGLITEYEYPDLDFHMDDHMEKQELELAISYTYFQGGNNPSFGSGLEYVNQFGIDAQLGGRPGVPDVVVFLTNGIPANATLAQAQAKILTEAGATVISISTKDVNNADLVSIASGCHYVIENAQSSGIGVLDIVEKALNLTCDAISQVPADECKCPMVEADVMFLLDASLTQGKDNFQKQKQFAEGLVEEFNIRPNETRVGAVTYSVHAHPQFGLDYHPEKFELRLALNFIPFQGEPDRNIIDGMSYINQNSFTKSTWNRQNVQKIVIVTVTGPLNSPDLIKQAQALRDQGVKIVAVGVGDASMKDLETISPNNVMFKDFNEMTYGAKQLAQKICQDDSSIPTPAPVTTPAASNPCDSVQCQNGGICTQFLSIATCDCADGFGGPLCAEVLTVPPTATTAAPTAAPTQAPATQAPATTAVLPASNTGPCRFNPCNNGGTCSVVGDKAVCRCAPGFTGEACFFAITSPPPVTTAGPTTPAPATSPQPTQASLRDVLGKAGCKPAEIVFMLERWFGDSQGDVDHEADLIGRLVRGWQIDNSGVRIAVAVYGSTIKEHIKLGDFMGDRNGLIRKLNNIKNEVDQGGSANVAAALDHARQNMFNNSRANADKIVVAVVHDMSSQGRRDIAAAAQKLKAEGITLYGLGVAINDIEGPLVQSHSDHYFEYSSFAALESTVPYQNYRPCR